MNAAAVQIDETQNINILQVGWQSGQTASMFATT